MGIFNNIILLKFAFFGKLVKIECDMAKIIQKHNECIGCGACTAVCPDFWEMGDDMKAKPKIGKQDSQTGDYEFEADEKNLKCNKEATEVCPIQIIKII